MEKRTLLKVWALASAMLLASGGWGFVTDKNSIINGNLTLDPDPATTDTTPQAGNLTVAGSVTVGTVSHASVPSGVIVMWSGAITAIPTGWALCDGTGETPNLRGKFVVGYDPEEDDYSAVREVGGSDFLELEIKHMPVHRHVILGDDNMSMDSRGEFGEGGWVDKSTMKPPTQTPLFSYESCTNAGCDYYKQPRPKIDLTQGRGGTNNSSIRNTDRSNKVVYITEEEGGKIVEYDRDFPTSRDTEKFDNRPAYYVLAYIIKL